MTPAAVNRDLAVLRILFNFAIRMKKAKTNPVVGVKFLPENNARMRVISFVEEAAYLHAASSTLRDIAIVILETGMRPGEVFHLRREDVNREFGFVQIPTGKTRFARRTIPVTARALEVLGRCVSSAQSEWLFPAMRNSSKSLTSVAGPHEAALRRSGIEPPFRLYDRRHTALTRMAMSGIDLPTLRELAGHASIQMTMRYVHPTPEHKQSAIKKFEGLRNESLKGYGNESLGVIGYGVSCEMGGALPATSAHAALQKSREVEEAEHRVPRAVKPFKVCPSGLS